MTPRLLLACQVERGRVEKALLKRGLCPGCFHCTHQSEWLGTLKNSPSQFTSSSDLPATSHHITSHVCALNCQAPPGFALIKS